MFRESSRRVPGEFQQSLSSSLGWTPTGCHHLVQVGSEQHAVRSDLMQPHQKSQPCCDEARSGVQRGRPSYPQLLLCC